MIEEEKSGLHAKPVVVGNFILITICLLLATIIFIADLSIPLGVAMGVPYVVVILISLWLPDKKVILLAGIICSLLTLIAFWYKPAVSDMWKVVFNRSIALFVIWVTVILGLQRKRLEQKKEEAILEREKAIEKIRVLQGMLPICSSCKKIRNDDGYWTQIEDYIRDNSEAEFSHSICPECTQRLYPDIYKKIMDKKDSGKS